MIFRRLVVGLAFLGLGLLAASPARAFIPFKIRKSESLQIQKAKAKLNSLKTEIEATERLMVELEKAQKDLEVENEKGEKDFRARFEKVLVPLLNWPQVPLAEKVPSWVEREHLRSILASLRSRLLKEPLELIATRAATTKEMEENRQSQLASLKNLQSRHGFLILQLEELLAMDKKEKLKKDALSGRQDPRKSGKSDDKNKSKWSPAETEGLGPL